MKIEIRDALSAATSFVPNKKTLLMRIVGSSASNSMRSDYLNLAESDLWVPDRNGLWYEFDDVTMFDYRKNKRKREIAGYQSEGYIIFGKEIARQILDNFSTYREQAECLLVHCSMGQSRSPAVAFALNKIFNLGNKLNRKNYPLFNNWVYRIMVETAKDIETS